MAGLELKVPPDAVLLAVAGLMWLAAALTPPLEVAPLGYRVVVAAVVTLLAVTLVAAAKAALARADTTLDFRRPDQTVCLVTTGAYRFTRNPIYLAMMLILLAWAVLLSNPASACVSAAFVAYIERFQIRPEERALRAQLGQGYAEYAHEVRRWL